MRQFLLWMTIALVTPQLSLAESAAAPSATVAAFAEPLLLGLKLGIRKAQADGKVPAAVGECVERLESSRAEAVVREILDRQLTARELKTADAFFASPAGAIYVKTGLMGLYQTLGQIPPEPVPELTAAERKAVERFARTRVGKKLLIERVMESKESQAVTRARVGELLDTCRMN